MERVKEGECGQCSLLYLHENRTMKPVEIILSRKVMREDDGRG
jgi:hypothetical protein